MKKATLVFGIALLLISCNSDKKKSSDSSDAQTSEKTSKKTDGKTYDCLIEFDDKYDELITREELASIYPFDVDEAKEKISNRSYVEYMVSWPSDRPDITMEVAGRTMNLPDRNTMGVAVLNFESEKSDLESIRDKFDMGYKDLSEEEIQKIEKNLENASEEVRASGEKLMAARKKNKSEFIDGIGSSAWYKWNENHGGELAVLAGRAKFNVRLKISDDPFENKEYAMKIASLILAKCD